MPGTVDRQGNGLVDSPQLGWNQVPLGATLRRELGLPVLVENNVNALAMAERLYGVGRRHESFLVVTIGTGVGAGIVVDGVVLRGLAGGAGEIGHMPVLDDGPLCTLRQPRLPRGDHRRGGARAHRAANAASSATAPGSPRCAPPRMPATPAATAIFSEAGHLLGRSLAGIVHTLDPEIVILLGEGTAAWPHWAFGFEPALRSALLPSRRGIGVVVETWQDESWAQGAAALVLATPFDSDDVAGEQGRLVRERLVEQSAREVDA